TGLHAATFSSTAARLPRRCHAPRHSPCRPSGHVRPPRSLDDRRVAPVSIRSKLGAGLVAIALVLLVPLFLALQSLEKLHSFTTVLQKREIRASMDSQLTVLAATSDSLAHLGMQSASTKIGTAVAQVASFVPSEYAAAA